MERVVVQIDRGIVDVVSTPKGVRVDVIDLDLLREGDVEDIQAYWGGALSRGARAYVKLHYPRMYDRLQREPARSAFRSTADE